MIFFKPLIFFHWNLERSAKGKFKCWSELCLLFPSRENTRKQNWMSQALSEALKLSFFGLCPRNAFGSWGNLSMAKSFSSHPSGQQFWYPCISIPCWMAADQDLTHSSIAQRVPPFPWTCFEQLINRDFPLDGRWLSPVMLWFYFETNTFIWGAFAYKRAWKIQSFIFIRG